jgi:FKBP-type peptidyl-prolyl cis-trans isomerase 2
MRRYRSLLFFALAAVLLTVGCAGPDQAAELEQAENTTLAPGTNATMPLVVNETEAEPGEVSASLSADGLDASVSNTVAENGSVAGWLTISADDSAEEGEHVVEVSLGEETRTLTVNVDEPDDPLTQGEQAEVTLTMRTEDGGVAMTNDEFVAEAPVPKASDYQEPDTFKPASIPLSPRTQLPEELLDALTGADANHSISVDAPGAFGPAEFQENRSREETVEREISASANLTLPPRQAQQILPRDVSEGDEVDVPVTQDNQALPYVVESMGQQQISLSLALEEGDNATLYEAWPNAAQVTNVTDGEATVRLDPGVEEGDTLTWNEHWGEVTEVTNVTSEQITLRHSPEEGLTYERMNERTQQAIETEVIEVTEDKIVISQANPHPLGGETVIFDITVLGRASPTSR